MPAPDFAAFRAQFPALEQYAWLNTAGVPPGATPVLAAMRSAMDRWADGTFDWVLWEADADHARAIFARWLGVPSSSVTLLATLADAAATVAQSVAMAVGKGHTRPRVVVSTAEFRSNLFPWLALADRGCDVTVLEPAADGLVRTDAIVAAIRPGVSLVAISEVQSATGHRIDARAIAARCRETGARSFFNLTQSLGALPFDVTSVDADYVAVHSYKWLISPRGATFLYTRPDWVMELAPLSPNWRNGADLFAGPNTLATPPDVPRYAELYGGPYALLGDARRADASLAWFSWVGARAALELLDTLPADAVETYTTALASAFRDGARKQGFHVAACERPSQLTAIEFASPADAGAASQRLQTAGVVTSARGNRLRFGFHAFNNDADVERALAALRSATNP